MSSSMNEQPVQPSAILRQLEQQEWQETFDAMSDFVAILDRDFRIVKANKAMAGFLKLSPRELIGLRCYEVMHSRHEPWPQCPHNEMLKSGRSVTDEILDPHIGIPLLVTASPVFDEQGHLLGSIHIARDISALKKARQEIEARNRELGILWSLGRGVQSSLSFDEVIASALEGLRTAAGPDLVLFYLRENDDLVLRGSLPADAENLNEKKQVGACLCGLAAQDRKPVFSQDIHADARCTLNECKEAGVRSFAALPLVHEDEMIGVIGIASRSERDYSEQREFLETIMATAALAARNARLLERLRRHAEDLEQSVRQRTAELEAKNAELERFSKLFVDREFRIKELRERVQKLEKGK